MFPGHVRPINAGPCDVPNYRPGRNSAHVRVWSFPQQLHETASRSGVGDNPVGERLHELARKATHAGIGQFAVGVEELVRTTLLRNSRQCPDSEVCIFVAAASDANFRIRGTLTSR
jgi:hypothetical protein